MDEQKEGRKTYKLEPVLEGLYAGYGLVTRKEFIEKLESNEFEIWSVPGNCYALIRWIDNGSTLEVLTCQGSVTGSAAALEGIEKIARNTGANKIIGFARHGWKPLLNEHEFETGTKLVFFRKELV